MLINIDPPSHDIPKFALFNLGFRPFFFGAATFAVLAMIIWMVIYHFNWQPELAGLSATSWHAHEMIYGYSGAVIAGFLLTAVKNWTGIQTLHGHKLAWFFILWAVTRLLALVQIPLEVIVILDSLFFLILIVAITLPVIKAGNKKQTGIIAKLVFLLSSNIIFYLGTIGIIENGIQQGLMSGLYLVIGLIIMLARRVIPFFIEKGVDYPVKVKNWQWLDISSLILFFIFWAIASFTTLNTITALLAITLFILHCIRLWGWYTHGIWQKPLLWVLYIAYIFIISGFLLTALSLFTNLSSSTAVHSYAVGGIGMMTIGMMARVSLGHTGRSIATPPRALTISLLFILTGAVVRVILPLLLPEYHSSWVVTSQILWIISFAIFLFIYTPILITRRADGRSG